MKSLMFIAMLLIYGLGSLGALYLLFGLIRTFFVLVRDWARKEKHDWDDIKEEINPFGFIKDEDASIKRAGKPIIIAAIVCTVLFIIMLIWPQFLRM